MKISANDQSGMFRTVYTVSIGEVIYVVHAFPKKSKRGISTPQSEIEVVRERLKQLRSEPCGSGVVRRWWKVLQPR